jgi:predicted outer membrane repeat protein
MRKRMVQAILGAAALVVGMLGTTAVANAVTGDTVSISCGDVPGLIAAINEANSEGGLTTILLAPSCDYVLTSAYTSGSGLPDVTGDIKLVGRFTTIERSVEASDFRIIEVADGGTLTAQGIRFSNGSRFVGGCFLVEEDGTLTIQHGEVDHCAAVFGGGILNHGELTVTEVNVSYNLADEAGGGILNDGFMQLQGTTMTRNSAFSGGAIYNDGEAVLSNSRVYSNLATFGAGVDEDGGTMTLVITWVAGNTPDNCYPAGSVVGCYG